MLVPIEDKKTDMKIIMIFLNIIRISQKKEEGLYPEYKKPSCSFIDAVLSYDLLWVIRISANTGIPNTII